MAVQSLQTRQLAEGLDEQGRDQLQQASGPGAGAFLIPAAGIAPLADVHFGCAVRRRLRLPAVSAPQPTCCHRSAAGNACAWALTAPGDQHAVGQRGRGGGASPQHGARRPRGVAPIRGRGQPGGASGAPLA